MKKYLSFVFYFLCLNFIILSCSSAFAYEKYLNGNKNFILVDGHMGYGFYLVKDSIKIYSRLSNKYELVVSAKIAVADERTKEITESYDTYYKYDLLANKMYQNKTLGLYNYVPKSGSWAETGVILPAGNLIFQILKGKKFYNI